MKITSMLKGSNFGGKKMTVSETSQHQPLTKRISSLLSQQPKSVVLSQKNKVKRVRKTKKNKR